MQNPFLYSGPGKALRKAAASTGNVVTETTTIPAGGYSEVVGGHDCKELLFHADFAAAATGDMVVRQVTTETATAGETYDTDTLAAKLMWNWNAGEALLGFWQIYNNTDQSATVYVNKRIA